MLAAFVLLIAGITVGVGIPVQGRARGDRARSAILIAVSPWRGRRTPSRPTRSRSPRARAKPADGPEYARYHNLVEGLCIAAGLPKPRLLRGGRPRTERLHDRSEPAAGRLAVTTGLLQIMNRVASSEGVLAHELSHVRNYDILVSTIAVTAVGAVALMADLGMRFVFRRRPIRSPRQQRQRRTRADPRHSFVSRC